MRMPHILVAAIAATLAIAAPAAAEPTWAPAASAPVHPGVQTVLRQRPVHGELRLLRRRATTSTSARPPTAPSTGGSTSTNGCDTGSLPLGTPVEVDGASKPGTLAYNSWLAMQAAGETDANTCDYNDLALVKLDPADYGKVNPSIPFWGGPTGLTDTTRHGRQGPLLRQLLAAPGHHAAQPEGGRSASARPAAAGATRSTPSRPASPVTRAARSSTATGKAFGVLSTLQIAPKVGANGVGDLSRELAYANAHGARRAARQRHRGLHGPAAAVGAPGIGRTREPAREHRGWAFALHGVSTD